MAPHPSLAALLGYFNYGHLPEGPVRDTSAKFHRLAHDLATTVPGSPELTAGLRHLLEAKDCAVRAQLGQCEPEPVLEPGEPTTPTTEGSALYGQRELEACPICGAPAGGVHDGHRHEQAEKARAGADTASPRGKQ